MGSGFLHVTFVLSHFNWAWILTVFHEVSAENVFAPTRKQSESGHTTRI